MVDLNLRPTRRQLRQFGFIALFAFSILGTVILYKGGLFGVDFGGSAEIISHISFLLAGASGALAWAWPAGNRPLFVLMSLIAFPIGLVVSHVALALLFYAVLTPVAIVFRLIGRDALERRFDPSAGSYWTDLPEVTEKKYYFHQY